MNIFFHHISKPLLLTCCCLSLWLAACGENSPRKFTQGFRDLKWQMPLQELRGPVRTLTPQSPLFPFDADVVVRDIEAVSLGHIPATRLAYAFTQTGFQAVRVDFMPEFLVPVRQYFQDSYGPAQGNANVLHWQGNGVRITLFPTAPGGPFALIEGPGNR